MSADSGYFAVGTTPQTQITSDATGSFEIAFHMSTTVPYSTPTVTLRATAPDQSTVSDAVTVAQPVLPDNYGHMCPANTFETFGSGFADGQYTISAPATTFTPTTVTANQGQLQLSTHLAPAFPASVDVTVTSVEHPDVTFTYPWNRTRSQLFVGPEDYWTHYYYADCLAAGESLAFHSYSARTISPTRVVADSHGTAYFGVRFVAAATPSSSSGVTFTGVTSQQSGYTGSVTIRGTTLAAGHEMTAPANDLVSAHLGWEARVQDCYVLVWHYLSDGSAALAWSAQAISPGTGCHLVLRPDDGNLVLYNAAGHGIWSTGTAGIGPNSRLIMRDDGALTLYTSAGHAAWSSAQGLIRTPSAIGQGQSLLRGQSLVNGTTRLILRTDGNLAVYRAGVARWSSHTGGRGGVRLLLGRFGLLVLLNASGHAVWSTNSYGGEPTRLEVLASGTIRELAFDGSTVWQTHTG